MDLFALRPSTAPPATYPGTTKRPLLESSIKPQELFVVGKTATIHDVYGNQDSFASGNGSSASSSRPGSAQSTSRASKGAKTKGLLNSTSTFAVRPKTGDFDPNETARSLAEMLQSTYLAKNGMAKDPRLRWHAYLRNLDHTHSGVPRIASESQGRSLMGHARLGCTLAMAPDPVSSETEPTVSKAKCPRTVSGPIKPSTSQPVLRLTSKAAIENYRQHTGSTMMQTIKHTDNVNKYHAAREADPEAAAAPPEYSGGLSKMGQEIRDKHVNMSQMPGVFDHKMPYDAPTAPSRCISALAIENLSKSRGSLNFHEMFKAREDLKDYDEDAGGSRLSGIALEIKEKHVRGNREVFVHSNEPYQGNSRKPAVNFAGVEIAERHSQGGGMAGVMDHRSREDQEDSGPEVSEKRAASAARTQQSSLLDIFEGRLQGDPIPPPRLQGQRALDIADQHTGSLMADTLHKYGLNEMESQPPGKVRPEAEEYAKQGQGVLSQMMRTMWLNGQVVKEGVGAEGAPPGPRVRVEAQENYNNHTNGTGLKFLLEKHGKLPGDPKASPNLRAGSRGPYKKAVAGTGIMDILAPKKAFELKHKRKRIKRASSAKN